MNTRRLYVASKRRRQVYLRKLSLIMTALVIVACLSIIGGSRLVAAHDTMDEEPVNHKYYKSIEINAGDTLWNIAEEHMSDEYDSVHEYISELKAINNLTSDDIHESQYLTVVYYDAEFK